MWVFGQKGVQPLYKEKEGKKEYLMKCHEIKSFNLCLNFFLFFAQAIISIYKQLKKSFLLLKKKFFNSSSKRCTFKKIFLFNKKTEITNIIDYIVGEKETPPY